MKRTCFIKKKIRLSNMGYTNHIEQKNIKNSFSSTQSFSTSQTVKITHKKWFIRLKIMNLTFPVRYVCKMLNAVGWAVIFRNTVSFLHATRHKMISLGGFTGLDPARVDCARFSGFTLYKDDNLSLFPVKSPPLRHSFYSSMAKIRS